MSGLVALRLQGLLLAVAVILLSHVFLNLHVLHGHRGGTHLEVPAAFKNEKQSCPHRVVIYGPRGVQWGQ